MFSQPRIHALPITSVLRASRRFLIVLLALYWIGGARQAQAEAMLQCFNTSWPELSAKIPEIAEAGYTSLWLPPPTKGSGGLSVGYDLWDRFDLGSKISAGPWAPAMGPKRSCFS